MTLLFKYEMWNVFYLGYNKYAIIFFFPMEYNG